MFQRVQRWARAASRQAGSPLVITVSTLSLAVFLAAGPYFQFSTGYQLVANTFMSAVSYVMIFILQCTQNREDRVLQIKLNEILRALPYADKSMIDIEDLSDADLESLSARQWRLAEEIRSRK